MRQVFPYGYAADAFADGYLNEEQAKALLLEKGIVHTEAEASRQIFEWQNGGAYKELKAAALANDEAAYRENMQALLAAGYTEKGAKSDRREIAERECPVFDHATFLDCWIGAATLRPSSRSFRRSP